MASKAETVGRLKPHTSRRWNEVKFETFTQRFEGPSELPRNRHLGVTTDDAPELVLIETLVGLIELGLRIGM